MNWIKGFETFEDISKPTSTINGMMICYGCVFEKNYKPVNKESRVEKIE